MENKILPNNAIPVAGELAIIRVKDGTLEILVGNINMKHDNLCVIEECTIENNEVNIKAKEVYYLEVDEKVTEQNGKLNTWGRSFDYNEIISMVENPEKAIQVYENKRNWLTKLLGYKDVKFNYILLEDSLRSNYFTKRKLLLKQKYWTPKEFKTNLYIFQKV